MEQVHPVDRVLQVCSAYGTAISLNCAARLKVADRLAAGPRPVAELAADCEVNEDGLYRVLRVLAAAGIFTEVAPRTFANTPASDCLRTDSEGSLHDAVVWWSDPFHLRIYAELMHSVRTGRPCADEVLGAPVFEYFPTDPEESEVFNRAMIAISAATVPAVLQAYDFSGIQTLVDVGGGHGSVIGAVLARYPQMRGVLCDLEHVVAGARPTLQRHGVAERCTTEIGDFFKAVPEGGDAYIMKHIIHDWEDERAVTILANIRKAMNPGGRVLLIEAVLPEGNDPDIIKALDLEMLTLTGGRERTEAEYVALFERAGLRLVRVVPTAGLMSVIEGDPAP